MPESGVFGFIYRVTDVVYKLAWSNILWFFTSGFPLVLFIFGDWIIPLALFLLIGPPGTVALFHVMSVWQKDGDVSVWNTYWSGWKKNWKRAYKVVDVYVMIGVILAVDLVVVANAPQSVLKWIGFLLFPTATLYVLTSVTLLPLLVRYPWKLFELVKNAFVLSVSHLFSSTAVLLSLGVVIVTAVSFMPPLAFFFSASLTAWAFTWQTSRILDKIDRLQKERSESLESNAM